MAALVVTALREAGMEARGATAAARRGCAALDIRTALENIVVSVQPITDDENNKKNNLKGEAEKEEARRFFFCLVEVVLG